MGSVKKTVRIKEKSLLTKNVYRIRLETDLCQKAELGQFVMVYPPDRALLLGRPLCIADAGPDHFDIVMRISGEGTRKIASCDTGYQLETEGPFGNGYPYDGATGGERAVLLGGGLGAPSLLFLAKRLRERDCSVTAVLGYRDKSQDHFLADDFKALGADTYIATDDGSEGLRGNVMEALNELKISADLIYACGPMPMLSAVKAYSEKEGKAAFISLEEHMACGVGVCLGCVVKTTSKDAHSHVNNARICTEGPVFSASEVDI